MGDGTVKIRNLRGGVWLLTVMLMVSFMGIGAIASEEKGPGVSKTAEARAEEQNEVSSNGLGISLAELDAAKETDSLVVVAGSGMDSSAVKVGYYRKNDEGVWQEQFCTTGFCGHNGMAADKREGDRRTPVGTYSFIHAFGSLADPGSILPYKQLDDGDYWVDDSDSPYYNQMVNTRITKKNWRSAEHLIEIVPQYRYALALNYNTDERIPGKGSAIFLHGFHSWKTWTEGCIAIPEEYVKMLVQQLDKDSRIVIMPDLPEAAVQ